MSKEVAPDPSRLTLEHQSTASADTEVNPVPPEGTTPQETKASVPAPPSTITVTTADENPAASINPGDEALAEGSEPSGSMS